MSRKEKILTTIIFVGFIIVLGIVGNIQTTYKMDAMVTSVQGEKVNIIDGDGDKWTFYGEGFEEGDMVRVTMFNNDTMTFKDDTIEKVKIIKE